MDLQSLSDYEKEFINIWGQLYENRSQSKVLGEIWGLLTLKADSPENGLDQQEISKILHKSLSTVSRQMKTLVDMQIVSFTDKGIRKYYTSKNFKQITNLRFQASIQEYLWTIEQLNSIKEEISNQEVEEYKNLINTINLTEKTLTNISNIYRKIINH
ncbi:MAG: hypothetical protein ACW981_19140 [Candidatus Hodarchaeales archaeon]|jgi:DNA-binding transcriptional regulator GbsR (MarR family)